MRGGFLHGNRSKAMRKILMCAAGGALAAALIGATAIAQKSEEVVVQASRIVTTGVGRDAATGAPINDITLSYGVSYSGLDLASTAGAAELEKRVNDAAQQACKEIGRQYPQSTPADAECAKAASAKAMVRVHELVNTAAKKPAK
jgi:UrcA family protein